jgi:hypothetical protein
MEHDVTGAQSAIVTLRPMAASRFFRVRTRFAELSERDPELKRIRDDYTPCPQVERFGQN